MRARLESVVHLDKWEALATLVRPPPPRASAPLSISTPPVSHFPIPPSLRDLRVQTPPSISVSYPAFSASLCGRSVQRNHSCESRCSHTSGAKRARVLKR